MAGFNGKWYLTDINNGQAYFDAIKSPEEYKNKLRAIGEAVKVNPKAYIEEITVDTAAKTVHRVVFINGELKRDSGVLAVDTEIDHPAADGRPAKIKITIDSDTKITRVENGDGFSTVSVADLAGDSLTVTATGNGQTSKMTYKRA